MAVSNFPWYEVVEGAALEQGDILRACPIMTPIPELSFPIADNETLIDVQYFDVIVMTQSCDLVNDKLSDIILCPHWGLTESGKIDPSMAKKETRKAIIKGYKYRYAMLDEWKDEISTDIRIVDFGRIFSLPKSFVSQFAANQGKRLRLSPPYREHLSQSFARFFMRVGLPQDIKLPE